MIWRIFRVPLKFRKLNKNIALVRMCTLPYTLSEKTSFKFIFNQNINFQGVTNVKNIILILNSTFWGSLEGLITSRDMFRSS